MHAFRLHLFHERGDFLVRRRKGDGTDELDDPVAAHEQMFIKIGAVEDADDVLLLPFVDGYARKVGVAEEIEDLFVVLVDAHRGHPVQRDHTVRDVQFVVAQRPADEFVLGVVQNAVLSDVGDEHPELRLGVLGLFFIETEDMEDEFFPLPEQP